MSSNDDFLINLQLKLSQFGALKAQGLGYADTQAETTKLLLAYGARIQAATLAKTEKQQP